MDFIGAKVLFTIILIILIVFAGAVPPAYKQFLDTWYGRLAAAVVILAIARLGGWYIGVAAAAAVLVLLPTRMREGFRGGGGGEGGSRGGRGGVLETGYDQTVGNFTDYDSALPAGDAYAEGFTDKVGLAHNSARVEGFAGADKRQEVPVERRGRWFIEEVLDESPEMIETDTVETSAGQ
jgi:hypothetical protein